MAFSFVLAVEKARLIGNAAFASSRDAATRLRSGHCGTMALQ
jgi:hypothetical protein